MINKRIIFLSASIWELLRFFLLFVTVLGLNISIIHSDSQYIFWLILIASGSLIMPIGFFLLYYDKTKYGPLLNLLRLGKTLGLFSSLLLILLEPVGPVLKGVRLLFLPFSIAPVILLLVITFFDLIFLGLLLSYKVQQKKPEIRRNENHDSLPDYKESQIHDL